MKKENREKRKEEILKLLKRGNKPASEISIFIGVNYYKIQNLLDELIKVNKIEKVNFGKNSYYKLIEQKNAK